MKERRSFIGFFCGSYENAPFARKNNVEYSRWIMGNIKVSCAFHLENTKVCIKYLKYTKKIIIFLSDDFLIYFILMVTHFVINIYNNLQNVFFNNY